MRFPQELGYNLVSAQKNPSLPPFLLHIFFFSSLFKYGRVVPAGSVGGTTYAADFV